MSQILWTKTDETPYLSSFSLLPILKRFLNEADLELEVVDISLAGRILAAFGLGDDGLARLEAATKKDSANIIKLPNISATVPQLKAAIAELKKLGYELPNYPDEIKNDEDKRVASLYAKVLGSAVNPVLRDGNSNRRSTKAVKDYAKKNPHFMGKVSKDSKSEIASMQGGDFYANERSVVADRAQKIAIKFKSQNGEVLNLKDGIEVGAGDILDASFLNFGALYEFFATQIKDAKQKDLVLSLHLKSSMMKISDPLIFGECLRAYFCDVFSKFKSEFATHNIKPQNGLKDIFQKLDTLEFGAQVLADFEMALQNGPSLAMIDSTTSNFDTPNGLIIDASMPAMLRNHAKMYDKNGELRDTKALIPDRTYSGVYEAVLADFKQNGVLDVAKLGSVSNIGLMAKKAQEYGSSDKTFVAPSDGEFVVAGEDELFKFNVSKGDIFRLCLTKNEAIQNWIDLAIQTAQHSAQEAIFWLDENRPSDANLIKIVQNRLLNLKGFEILSPNLACAKTLGLIRAGKDCISVTGNVLRDYLTDLFPIFELGTSAKMLSSVPLLSGGAMFETGAGGTAPLLAKQLLGKNYLIWDSLGEFLALNASLEHCAFKFKNKNAQILAKTLDEAISRYLDEDRSPKAEFGALDTRLSHFYLALFWAQALSQSELAFKFEKLAQNLNQNEDKIIAEISAVYGKTERECGWYALDEAACSRLMQPSQTLNQILKAKS